MTLTLLRIEGRCSIALWLVPIILVLAWFYFAAGSGAFYRRFLWAEVSVAVRNTAFFTAPCLAGAAAWMAGRERRRGMDELLGTLPGSALGRQLATLLAVILWGAAAYLLIAAILVVITARHATWGGPILWPGIIGLLALGTYAALGFLIGSVLPSRFTAPLVAVLAFFVQGITLYFHSGDVRFPDDPRFYWLTFLSPVVELAPSPWYGIQPNVGGSQACFLFGLAGLAVASLAVRGRGGMVVWLACGLCLLLTALGVFSVYRAVPPGGREGVRVATLAQPIPYIPRCSDDPLPVCVHPAFGSWLEKNSPLINRIAAPLVGLPGTPTRAVDHLPKGQTPSADLLFFTPQPRDDSFADQVAQALLHSLAPYTIQSCPDLRDRGSCLEAQSAVALWLVRRANAPEDPRYPPLAAISAAADRFGALPEETRRAWLREQLVALREGRVPLSALP